MRNTQTQPPGVGGTAQVYIEQYTPLKGVGGGRSYLPPMSQWQVPRLGLNRLLYLLWALHTLRTPVVINSVPALMTHLLPLLLRHFDGWLPGIRRALFWPPSLLLGDDNFWFPGKCDSSSPNVL